MGETARRHISNLTTANIDGDNTNTATSGGGLKDGDDDYQARAAAKGT